MTDSGPASPSAGGLTPAYVQCDECQHVFTAREVAAENREAWGHPCYGVKGCGLKGPRQSCESYRVAIAIALPPAPGEARPSAPPADIDSIIQAVAELPDRTSPEDWPEAMLVTAEELRTILQSRVPVSTPGPLKALEQEIGALEIVIRTAAVEGWSIGPPMAKRWADTLRDLLAALARQSEEPPSELGCGCSVTVRPDGVIEKAWCLRHRPGAVKVDDE